jgi:hypothetical protein
MLKSIFYKKEKQFEILVYCKRHNMQILKNYNKCKTIAKRATLNHQQQKRNYCHRE